MTRIGLLGLVCVVGCGGTSAALDGAASPTTDQGEASKVLDTAAIDAYLDSYGAQWGEAFAFGGVIQIRKGGTLVYERVAGQADRTTARPISAETSFRIGSVTKPFTAVAIFQLMEAGKLSLDDPISRHLPHYPEVGKKVTIRHLLSHQSGIPNYTENPNLGDIITKPHTLPQLMTLFQEAPLHFEPGTQFKYSNSGYVVLGAIIEAVSGQPYAEVLRAQIFQPLGMNQSEVGDAESDPKRAQGYHLSPTETLVPAPPIHMSLPYAAGAIRSTCPDLHRFDRALAEDSLLSATSKQLMFTPDEGRDYAHGWGTAKHHGHPLVGHSGGINGFSSGFARFLDEDIMICVLTNQGDFDAGLVRWALSDVVAGKPPTPRVELAIETWTNEARKSVEGTYHLTPDAAAALEKKLSPSMIAGLATLSIQAPDDSPMRLAVGPLDVPLYPASTTELFTRRHAARLILKRDAQGQIETVQATMMGGFVVATYRATPPEER